VREVSVAGPREIATSSERLEDCREDSDNSDDSGIAECCRGARSATKAMGGGR
jgi:hypothetical protein